MKKIITLLILTVMSVVGWAQSGTNSPYSQYGLGVLSDQSTGFSRGMNGLGLGFREHNQINAMNPASYSSIDSLSFVFDAGLSGQFTHFEEGGLTKNARNADLEYVVAGFRLTQGLGLSFGLLPLTNVGYNYSNTVALNGSPGGSPIKSINSYTGKGGLREVYLGLGWELFKGFSLGINGGYLWGEINRTVVNSFTDASISSFSKAYTMEVANYDLLAGLQYTVDFSKKTRLTIGVNYRYGHQLRSDANLFAFTANSQTNVADTTTYSIRNAYEVPTMISGGLMFDYGNRLKIGADYSCQQWKKLKYPVFQQGDDHSEYVLKDNQFVDRHKITIGGVYCYDEHGRTFGDRLRYRFGVSYATPYLKINGLDGPKEISVSAGLGIPIVNAANNRSILNISGQWVCQDATSFIKENTFKINIGITFNERWFAKWKVQ